MPDLPYLGYNLELSLSILKLVRPSRRGVGADDSTSMLRVGVTRAEEGGTDWYEVTRDRQDSAERLLEREQHLFRTWPFDDYDIRWAKTAAK